MRRIVLAASMMLIVGLTACSAPVDEVPRGIAAMPAETPSPTITAPPEAEVEPGEAALLEAVRGFRAVPILDSVPDEQIIAAGYEACAQFEAGVRLIDVKIIEGDDPAKEGTLLAKTAHAHLCPDLTMDMSVIP